MVESMRGTKGTKGKCSRVVLSNIVRLIYDARVVLQGSLRLENYSAWAARVFPDGRRFTDR